jgi:hypothetical protein
VILVRGLGPVEPVLLLGAGAATATAAAAGAVLLQRGGPGAIGGHTCAGGCVRLDSLFRLRVCASGASGACAGTCAAGACT